jgi:hypothetical protein
MPRIETATLKECPAVKELADTIAQVRPNLTLHSIAVASPGTRHTSGVALDIMLPEADRAWGNKLVDALIARYEAIRWSSIIYASRGRSGLNYYWVGAGKHGYSGDRKTKRLYTQDTRHGDHIHIDWVDFNLKRTGAAYNTNPYIWSEDAKTTGFGTQLSGDILKFGIS